MASSRKHASADLDLVAHLRAAFAARLFPGVRLCVGLSGGIDSSVLLNLLVRLRAPLGFQLSAIHVNHGLSPKADAWQQFCVEACTKMDVPFEVATVRVERTGRGLEAAARVARHAAFERQAVDFIVLGHHLNDQVETFFMRLLRGAGVKGLAGMSEFRKTGEGSPVLWRPLLSIPRSVLEAYAADNGIAFVEDESNQDLAYTRNFIRNSWLPDLESRFPGWMRQVERAQTHFMECVEMLDEVARQDLSGVATGQGLNLNALARLGRPRARNLLRYWLAALSEEMPSKAQLEDLLNQMLDSSSDAQPDWCVGKLRFRRHQGVLLRLPLVAKQTGNSWTWSGELEINLGENGHLVFTRASGAGVHLADACVSTQNVQIRLRQGGERLQPHPERPRRTLKNLLRETGIAPWQREMLPLLFIDDDLAWVPGVGVDSRYQAAEGQPGWVISWRPPHP